MQPPEAAQINKSTVSHTDVSPAIAIYKLKPRKPPVFHIISKEVAVLYNFLTVHVP